MQTKIIKITGQNSKKVLNKAAAVIKNGGLVVFPTETVYGLGANVFDEKALGKIFLAKGRPSDNPLIVHISDKKELVDLTDSVTENQQKLINAFWPGPLTIIFEKKDNISNIVSGGLSTIAVRMSLNIFANELIKLSGVPIAAPSANTSGRPSGTTGEDIYNELNGRVDMIIDDGESDIGVESTVVKINDDSVLILRPGAITKEMLEKVLYPLPVSFAKEKSDLQFSPGTKYKHYAPKVKLEIFKKEEIQNRIKILENKNFKIGIITTEQNENLFSKYLPDVFVLGDENNLEEISQKLYSALRFFDTHNVDIILCQSFKEEGIGVAIMDRLNRASSEV
ncbi:MAG: L-threonylcarbamoyladenylate synthase [Patescibacteria group bacterium]